MSVQVSAGSNAQKRASFQLINSISLGSLSYFTLLNVTGKGALKAIYASITTNTVYVRLTIDGAVHTFNVANQALYYGGYEGNAVSGFSTTPLTIDLSFNQSLKVEAYVSSTSSGNATVNTGYEIE